ncbi:MAG: DUF2207 domain-containing protein [Clostridia bacterium]|nr:DUF2207 domain-containing protein [Clostridia bacterium]
MDNDRRLSVLSLILAVCSLAFCFLLGYPGPIIGLLGAIAAFLTAGTARRSSPDGINKAGRIIALISMTVNAVSCLALLLMLLLGAALLGSPGGFF